MIVLFSMLIIVSIVLLIIRFNRESLLLFGMVISSGFFFFGLLIYIAKKGGIGREMEWLFYLSHSIKTWLQYRVITLGQMGYIVAVGRYLFPLFLIWLAIYYSLSPWLRNLRKYAIYFLILPIMSLILYFPPIFCKIAVGHLKVQKLIVTVTKGWIIVYLLLSVLLLGYEYFSITIPFMKRSYLAKALLPLSLALLYGLYFPQDPAQIYLFHSSDYMWLLGLWYLNPLLSFERYIAVVACTAISAGISFPILLRRTQISIMDSREEIVLQRTFRAASMGVSVFVHSTKNQLLADHVLHQRIKNLIQEPNFDKEKLLQYVQQLSNSNEQMLNRMEELYQTVRAKNTYLVVTELNQIIQKAQEKFLNKYPTAKLQIKADQNILVLADETHLSEAIYNLLTNGWEANCQAGRVVPLQIWIHQERLYTVIEIHDAGNGIPKQQRKKIFEPFYSSKNSRFNWGMGLYYVRQIVQNHMGHIRLESKEGQGTNFLILLPRYIPNKGEGGILAASCERKELWVKKPLIKGGKQPDDSDSYCRRY